MPGHMSIPELTLSLLFKGRLFLLAHVLPDQAQLCDELLLQPRTSSAVALAFNMSRSSSLSQHQGSTQTTNHIKCRANSICVADFFLKLTLPAHVALLIGPWKNFRPNIHTHQ